MTIAEDAARASVTEPSLRSSSGAGRDSRSPSIGSGPYRRAEDGSPLSCPAMSEAQQYICESCGFIYDPEEGDPDGGVPAGTPFEEIPDDWFCPVCGARKKDFSIYEG
jgi:rubredoxin